MRPKVLREETMVEMEVDDTIESSARVQRNQENQMLLDELNMIPLNEDKKATLQQVGYCMPVAPLTENYLKYCQNFKPKKPRSFKQAQKENDRAY